MNNRIVGLFLIGLTLLTVVIAYSIGELIDAIKVSSAFVAGSISGSGGGQLDWGGDPISTIPILLILISLIIGIILFIRNEK